MNIKNIKFTYLFVFTILFLGCFFVANSADAATHYVDSSCVNNGDGSSETCAAGAGQAGPFNGLHNLNAQLDGGVDVVQPGDTVAFKRGLTYGIGVLGKNLNIDTSGTDGNPITFSAYGTGARPVIDGTANSHAIDFRGQSYLIFEELDIREGSNAFYAIGNSTDVTIDNCTLSGTTHGIVLSTGTFTNFVISNITAGSTLSVLEAITGAPVLVNMTLSDINQAVNGGSAIKVVGVVNTFSVTSSTFAGGVYGMFLSLSGGSAGVTIHDFSLTGSSGYGIYIEGSVDGVDIDNATITGNRLGGSLFTNTGGQILLRMLP